MCWQDTGHRTPLENQTDLYLHIFVYKIVYKNYGNIFLSVTGRTIINTNEKYQTEKKLIKERKLDWKVYQIFISNYSFIIIFFPSKFEQLCLCSTFECQLIILFYNDESSKKLHILSYLRMSPTRLYL